MTRKFVIAATAALATTALATPAHATGGSPIRPYVGVLAGYDNVDLEVLGESAGKGNIMYGVLAGVEADVASSMFLGLEAELNDSEVSETEEDVLVIGDEARLSAGREIFAGVRAGFRAAPSVSIYGVGGYSNARVKASYTDGADEISEGINLDGYRLGAGVELGLGKFRVRGEYRHAEYENVDVDIADVDTSRDQFVAAAVLAF